MTQKGRHAHACLSFWRWALCWTPGCLEYGSEKAGHRPIKIQVIHLTNREKQPPYLLNAWLVLSSFQPVRGGDSCCGAKSLQAGNKFLHDCTFLLCPYVLQYIRIFMLLRRFG